MTKAAKQATEPADANVNAVTEAAERAFKGTQKKSCLSQLSAENRLYCMCWPPFMARLAPVK
jgi:NAD(P)H-flavin reductase